jgi:acyl carrier protein
VATGRRAENFCLNTCRIERVVEEIIMKLNNIVGSVLGVEPVHLTDASNSQNTPKWDSLRHIEVIFAIESAYHVRFTMSEITSLKNLGDIRRILASKSMAAEVAPETVLRTA